MTRSTLRSYSVRSLFSFAAAALFAANLPLASADNQTKSTPIKLTPGDFKELAFVPSAPGVIKANATWNTVGALGLKSGKDVPLKMRLLLPDGKVAKEVV